MSDEGSKLKSLKASFKKGLSFCATFLAAIALIIVFALMKFASDSTEIKIESVESKNAALESVFNKISFQPGKDRDIWMMNQSHFGSSPETHQWERLAIIIDKTKSPKVARYYQIKPGELVWEESLKNQRVDYRASCYTCHNNGPRAIRAVSESILAPLTWQQKLKIQAWNFRIKTYGRIVYDSEHDKEDPSLKVPFGYHTEHADAELKVATCTYCHKDGGFLTRGSLKRQQTGTIRSLVERGEMPPPGFKLSAQEKNQLEDFLRGF